MHYYIIYRLAKEPEQLHNFDGGVSMKGLFLGKSHISMNKYVHQLGIL